MVSPIASNSMVCSLIFWGWQQRGHRSSILLVVSDWNPPVTGGFPSQRASGTESLSMLSRHHEHKTCHDCGIYFDEIDEWWLMMVWSDVGGPSWLSWRAVGVEGYYMECWWQNDLTHCPLVDVAVILRVQFSSSLYYYLGHLLLIHWGRDKWPPFSRRHFQMHFVEWKCINFD